MNALTDFLNSGGAADLTRAIQAKDMVAEPQGHFDHIYGRDAQIRRVLDALALAKRTELRKRKHCLLDGPPASGKSEIMLAVAKMLGQEEAAYRWYDATSMTRAGAIKHFMESETCPPVLFIEEIEKCAEEALRWLLSIMDQRGEVRRTNCRVGNERKAVRVLVIASANDVPALKKFLSGALYSRFANKVYCPAPDRPTMKKILQRENEEIKGRAAWVEPALAFGFDKWAISDSRDMINILSCGGDRLLNQEYQRDYEETMHPDERKDLLKAKKARDKAVTDE